MMDVIRTSSFERFIARHLPLTILITNGFDPLRDVGHAYAQKLAAAGNDLTYVRNPDLTHGFLQFTHHSAACDHARIEIADLIKAHID
jgi:acetyl esterase